MTSFVLVHGAWHTSWCWTGVAQAAHATGARLTVVDLPGRDDPAAAASATPDDVIGAVVSAIIDASEPVVLVGHSLSGVVIGHAAQRVPHLVDTLVYVAAFAPKPGTSALDVISSPDFARSLALRHHVDPDRGLSTFPVEVAHEAFYGDADPRAAAAAAARLVPEGLAMMAYPTAEPAADIERLYIECLRDKAIPIEAQRDMQISADISRVETLDADHSPFLTQPDELWAILASLAPSSTAGG